MITEMAAANRYLAEHCLPAYNRRFAVPAPEGGTAVVADHQMRSVRPCILHSDSSGSFSPRAP